MSDSPDDFHALFAADLPNYLDEQQRLLAVERGMLLAGELGLEVAVSYLATPAGAQALGAFLTWLNAPKKA